MTHKIERKVNKTIRNEVIDRLEKLKEEIKDMDAYVRQDMDDDKLRDEDIFRINEKMKELERQIINVIEGQGHYLRPNVLPKGEKDGKQVF